MLKKINDVLILNTFFCFSLCYLTSFSITLCEGSFSLLPVYIKETLEIKSHKTTVLRPLKSYLTNNPRKKNTIFGARLMKKIRTHERCFTMDSYRCTRQCEPTNKDLHSFAQCWHWILSGRSNQSDGWLEWKERERKREKEWERERDLHDVPSSRLEL